VTALWVMDELRGSRGSGAAKVTDLFNFDLGILFKTNKKKEKREREKERERFLERKFKKFFKKISSKIILILKFI